jgi:hypothetical protein
VKWNEKNKQKMNLYHQDIVEMMFDAFGRNKEIFLPDKHG